MSPTTLLLPSTVRDTLAARASDGAPAEVCGVLYGTDREADTIRVTGSSAVRNVATDPRTRYELDPAETAQAFADVAARADDAGGLDESTGTDVVGFYHSHPQGPAGPSATDRAQAQWPGYVYLIVSLGGESGAAVRAWRWTGESFESLVVQVVDGASWPDDGDAHDDETGPA